MASLFVSVIAVHPKMRDHLIAYYFHLGYTWKEMCGFLICAHNIAISLRQMKRIVQRLRLRRYNQESDLAVIIENILKLHKSGFVNAGYRTVWKVLNTRGKVRVSQETVRLILKVLDDEGVQLRSQHRLRRRSYFSRGPNYSIHIDGYDKLKPYGIAIHGCIDGYSRKILWLKAAYTNNDPKIVARYYLDYIKTIRKVPRLVRSDCGTENCIIRDIQTALRFNHGDSMSGPSSFLYGRSTSNQRIERLWDTLSNNCTFFWKNLFKDLREIGRFHDHDPIHVECLRFCFLGLIQSDLDEFVQAWNHHRIRLQPQNESPSGMSPDVMFFQSELNNATTFAYTLPCDVNELDVISREYTLPRPRFGCCEIFVQLMEEVLGRDRDDLEQPNTVQLAVNLYTTMIEYFDSH